MATKQCEKGERLENTSESEIKCQHESGKEELQKWLHNVKGWVAREYQIINVAGNNENAYIFAIKDWLAQMR